MAEYIEREALLEDIQAAVENGGMGGMVAGALKRYVKRVPAADVVEVVRCKDCESFLRDSDLLQRHICIRWYPGNIRAVKPDDFCSYGKRKEVQRNE